MRGSTPLRVVTSYNEGLNNFKVFFNETFFTKQMYNF